MAPRGGRGYQPFPDIDAWTAVQFDPTTYDQYAALLEQARADATEEAREARFRVDGQGVVVVSVASAPPAEAKDGVTFRVAVAISEDVAPVVVVPVGLLAYRPVELSRRDCTGGIREVAKIKIDTWVRGATSVVLGFVAEQATKARKAR